MAAPGSLWFLMAMCGTVWCRLPFRRQGTVDGGCGFQSCAPISKDYLNVHIVCHSHLDAGWLDTVDNMFTSTVEHIYTGVRDSLLKYPERRFVSAENVYFSRWYKLQTQLAAREAVHELVRTGRLQFVGGGWTQNDEAVTHYTAIVDQMTLGLRFLNDTFGECGGVKVAWQIDPFGHSRGFATLLAEMGYDCLVVGRIHHVLHKRWVKNKRLEFIWKPSTMQGPHHDLFTLAMYGFYATPSEFCIADSFCAAYDNKAAMAHMADEILKLVFRQSAAYATNNILIFIGGDMEFQNAPNWFNQIDASIKAINALARKKSHRVRALYSTPLCYLAALHASNRSWPVFRGDLMPYSDVPGRIWVGFYSSRPNLKEHARYANSFLQACKQLVVLGGLKDASRTQKLKEAVAILQHHDAITGTSKAAVSRDYSRMLAQGVADCEVAMSRAVNQLMDPIGAAGDLPWRFCHALNASACDASEKIDLNETDGEFTLLLYNPASTPTAMHARLPVASDLQYLVKGPKGEEVETQAVPLIMTLLKIPERKSHAKTELVFGAELPPLGFSAFRVAALKKKEESPLSPASLDFLQLEPEQRFVENERYRLELDTTTGLVRRVTLLGQESWVTLRQSFYSYSVQKPARSYAPAPGGTYLLYPDTNRPVDLGNRVAYRVVQGPLVTEVHQIYDHWLSQVIRLYKNSPFIEFEWIVGPLPAGESTDVVTRYETTLDNDGVFFTDSNGMFTVTRRVNESLDPETVASSYYPVVSWIYIKNHAEDLQMTVFPDRPHGGTSWARGSIELMLHRRYMEDDGVGIDEPLDDRGVNGEGIVAMGRHRLHLGTPQEAAQILRTTALQDVYRPVYMFYPSPLPNKARKQHTELRAPLPKGIHLMTLESIDNDKALVRLEHIGQEHPVNVSVTHLLHSYLLLDAHETVLSAHRYQHEVPRSPWASVEAQMSAASESEELYAHQVRSNTLVSLHPGQIRTFLATPKPFTMPPPGRVRASPPR